ncbi:MAG: glycoside hydrolase family 5 protein [Lachnospiraceae bacterium]|nr:glycoside hydrolase family 5 protein [Lachnospiraceae bacterium]
MLKEKGFYRGINLGGWLSQCDYSEERLNHFITEPDFEKIASWGLDHVRIPIDYNVLENEDGSFDESGFARVEKALEFAKKYGLKAIIDLHKTAGFSFDEGEQETGFFDNDKYQERFYRLWEELAKHFGKDTENVAFELLNEVTEQRFSDTWNRISRECIKRIRAYAPDTLILLGSYWNNSPEAVKDLEKPYDDKVIYNFHCYSPMEFTHQGAPWVKNLTDTKTNFEDMDITPEFFEKLFAEAMETARNNGTSLYCGEYGVIDRATPEDALKWFKVINSVFEKYKIARAAWSYKEMDFGLSDSRMDGVREELIKYL